MLLDEYRRGDRAALDRLVPLVYGELHKAAALALRGERAGHTLRPTALVHEAYMRMVGHQQAPWQNRAHFIGCAAQLMRRILVDSARARRARKRGGGETRVTLEEGIQAAPERDVEMLALDEALERLARLSERQAKIVELRYFGGLSVEETAEALGVSAATVKNDWALAKAWLYEQLRD
jgi:RNA polymerase sigma factor (TIGR02999 family)